MQIKDLELKGLKLIETAIYKDDRGFFVERFNKKLFAEAGLPIDYFQDNHSFSLPNVVRGLHYQQNPAQAKLVGCISGAIWDVAVDIRANSPTFGKYFATELTANNGKLLFIPAGFAHGFCVIGNEPANVLYKVDNAFSKFGDGGIAFDDPDLAIAWPVKNPIISDKDKNLISFAKYRQNPLF